MSQRAARNCGVEGSRRGGSPDTGTRDVRSRTDRAAGDIPQGMGFVVGDEVVEAGAGIDAGEAVLCDIGAKVGSGVGRSVCPRMSLVGNNDDGPLVGRGVPPEGGALISGDAVAPLEGAVIEEGAAVTLSEGMAVSGGSDAPLPLVGAAVDRGLVGSCVFWEALG